MFSNSRYRFLTVKLNGERLTMTPENFWVNDGDAPEAPYRFELMTYGGGVVSFEVDDLFEEQDTGAQFDGYYRLKRTYNRK